MAGIAVIPALRELILKCLHTREATLGYWYYVRIPRKLM